MGKAGKVLGPCRSEGSSTSPAATEGDELNKLEEKVVAAPEAAAESCECKQLKEKVVCEEEEKSFDYEKPLVSPTTGIRDLTLIPSDLEEKCEDDNFEMALVVASNNDMGESSIKPRKESYERVYPCCYCERKFISSQALGGHQNAHREARALAKEEQRGVLPSFHHCPPSNHSPYNHYSAFPQEPSSMYGGSGSYNRSLGVKADSMIHKPSPKHPWSTSTGLAMGYRFGQHANPWSTHDVSYVDRLKLELAVQMRNNNNNHSFATAAPSTFQGSGMAALSTFQGSGNGVWNFLGVPPNNNDLNFAEHNGGSGSAGDNSSQQAAINGPTNSNQQQDESSSDLDLDLKL